MRPAAGGSFETTRRAGRLSSDTGSSRACRAAGVPHAKVFVMPPRRTLSPLPLRPLCAALVLAFGLVTMLPHPAAAQQGPPQALRSSEPSKKKSALVPAEVVKTVKVEQKLNAQVPLDLTFRDETGKAVRLGDYFGRKKPVLLSLVYYGCPGLCTMTLNGMTSSFRPLEMNVGDEFEVLTVSFDPKETPALAAKKKAEYIKSYGRAGAENGWHFLTGDPEPIRQLTDAVGFRYVYDPATGEYAHGSAIMLLTPSGKVSRYFYGLEYSSRDLRLGVVEASEEKIGTLADAVNLLCYQYDPATGRYSWSVLKLLRVAAVLTVAGIGTYILVSVRRERRRRRGAPPGGGAPGGAGLIPGAAAGT